ncbi:MAG TPA: MmcQ/YjbR family DNA-binding protein [Terriglobales bacterium]|nr:MmcQ/YjbR family DNA-binding protein [Terriglobales bacterium]
MNLDLVRALCLSFPRTTENVQWEDELCFKVGGKIFAMVGLASVPQRLVFKCDPENFADLAEREGILPAPYVGRYKWVMLESMNVLPDSELVHLIRESYTMVATKAKPMRSVRGRGRPRHTIRGNAQDS